MVEVVLLLPPSGAVEERHRGRAEEPLVEIGGVVVRADLLVVHRDAPEPVGPFHAFLVANRNQPVGPFHALLALSKREIWEGPCF